MNAWIYEKREITHLKQTNFHWICEMLSKGTYVAICDNITETQANHKRRPTLFHQTLREFRTSNSEDWSLRLCERCRSFDWLRLEAAAPSIEQASLRQAGGTPQDKLSTKFGGEWFPKWEFSEEGGKNKEEDKIYALLKYVQGGSIVITGVTRNCFQQLQDVALAGKS